MPLSAGIVPLTQLRVRLDSASPTLCNPLPHWPQCGRGKGEGAARATRAISSRRVGRPAGEELAMTLLPGVFLFTANSLAGRAAGSSGLAAELRGHPTPRAAEISCRWSLRHARESGHPEPALRNPLLGPRLRGCQEIYDRLGSALCVLRDGRFSASLARGTFLSHHPAQEAVRKSIKAAKKALQRGRACFETLPPGAPQHEVTL
jgi:hypothetical protein